jgi:hypothetical protein
LEPSPPRSNPAESAEWHGGEPVDSNAHPRTPPSGNARLRSAPLTEQRTLVVTLTRWPVNRIFNVLQKNSFVFSFSFFSLQVPDPFKKATRANCSLSASRAFTASPAAKSARPRPLHSLQSRTQRERRPEQRFRRQQQQQSLSRRCQPPRTRSAPFKIIQATKASTPVGRKHLQASTSPPRGARKFHLSA